MQSDVYPATRIVAFSAHPPAGGRVLCTPKFIKGRGRIMAGYRGYRGQNRRARYPQREGRIPRVNKYAGPCHFCGAEVPAERGQLYAVPGKSLAPVHLATSWKGSPVSGRYVGGCPGDADKMNTPILARRVPA